MAIASGIPLPAAPTFGRVRRQEKVAPGRLGVLTTSRAEVACWLAPRARMVRALASGADGVRARVAAERLVAEGIAGLVSFGLASGLAPIARPGDLVVAESVALPSGETIRTDDAWRQSLLGRLSAGVPKIHVARVAGADQPLITVGAKQGAFRATFAAAVDTESHAVAEVAVAYGLPFVVVRAIADPVERPRPALDLLGIGAQGEPRHFAQASRCLRRPWELVALWRHERSANAAFGTLRRIPIGFPMPAATPVT